MFCLIIAKLPMLFTLSVIGGAGCIFSSLVTCSSEFPRITTAAQQGYSQLRKLSSTLSVVVRANVD